jgi:hypothetical protein
MPYLATLTVKITRKFQLEKDDWIGIDALATIAVEEAEANMVDPADVRRMARQQARATVMEQIAEELAERDARRAAMRQQAQTETQDIASRREAADQTTGELPAAPPPTSTAEAEQRFYHRYSAVIGGDNWSAVQRYTGIRTRPPTTIKAWYAVAEAIVRRMQTSQPAASNGRH